MECPTETFKLLPKNQLSRRFTRQDNITTSDYKYAASMRKGHWYESSNASKPFPASLPSSTRIPAKLKDALSSFAVHLRPIRAQTNLGIHFFENA